MKKKKEEVDPRTRKRRAMEELLRKDEAFYLACEKKYDEHYNKPLLEVPPLVLPELLVKKEG